MISGGIDIGGTKIEARLFAADFTTIERRRLATPKDDLAGFMAVLVDQVEWLQNVSRSKALAVGVAFPGLIDPGTKRAFTSNLPAGGHAIEYILAEKVGRCLPMINDCQAFALSEANGGAGDGFKTIVGLIMGTGVGAGLVSGARSPNGSTVPPSKSAMPACPSARLRREACRCGLAAAASRGVSSNMSLDQVWSRSASFGLGARDTARTCKAGKQW